MAYSKNLVGLQIQKIRKDKGLTQDQLCAKCATAGWDLSRISLAKIESQLRYVSDIEVIFFAKLFKIPLEDLYPKVGRNFFKENFNRKESHHLRASQKK